MPSHIPLPRVLSLCILLVHVHPTPLVPAPPAAASGAREAIEEAIAAKDWGKAARGLQALFDSGATFDLGSGRRTSARHEAIRLLLSLPPEGRETYALAHKGEARELLAAAKRDHDLGKLAEVYRRFPGLDEGWEAGELLATYHLDRGSPDLAADELTSLLELVSDSSPDRPRLLARLAVAQAGTGDTESARASLAKIGKAPFALGQQKITAADLDEDLKRTPPRKRFATEGFVWRLVDKTAIAPEEADAALEKLGEIGPSSLRELARREKARSGAIPSERLARLEAALDRIVTQPVKCRTVADEKSPVSQAFPGPAGDDFLVERRNADGSWSVTSTTVDSEKDSWVRRPDDIVILAPLPGGKTALCEVRTAPQHIHAGILDLSTGETRTLAAYFGPAVAWSTEIVDGGKRALCVLSDGTTRIVNLESGKEERKIETFQTSSAALLANRDIISVQNQVLIMRDVETGKGTLVRTPSAVDKVIASPDGKKFAAWALGGSRALVRSPEADASARAIDIGRDDHVRTVAFSPDGTRLAVAGKDRIFLLDTATGDRVGALAAAPGPVSAVKFAKDDRSVTAFQGGKLCTWPAAKEPFPLVFENDGRPHAELPVPRFVSPGGHP